MAKRDLTSEQKKIQDYLKTQYKKKTQYENDSIRWPSHITVEIDKEDNGKIKKVTLTLTKEAIGLATESKNNKNMQDNDACFEGWAVALKAAGIEKINLNVVDDKIPLLPFSKGKGHYGRFLYRALRFSEQYDWFSLEKSLDRVVTNFKKKYLKEYLEDESVKKYLEDKSVILCNNVPDNEAGKNGKIECYIEALMASEDGKEAFLNSLKKAKDEEDINLKQQVYRQLPVGLFLGEVKKGNQVFTGGASAIDLWTLKGDTLQVVELKADNKMVGIITEIFFYSNYMYDLLIKKTFQSTEPKFNNGDEKNRGYDILKSANIQKIEGFMLADEYHPLITLDVLGVLNADSKKNKIQYFRAEYDFDVTIKQK